MAILANTILLLRKDPRISRIPPYLSALCVLIGVIWLILMPLNEYSRSTYISENALLPGQVHTYFGGSEQDVFNAYRHEVESLMGKPQEEVSAKLEKIFKSSGLKVARQKYDYRTAGNVHSGENVYSVLHAPRGDATEAIVLVAAWRNVEDELNTSGVALVLTLARYFKRWSLWSKDIIFLITPDSKAGPQAWVDAYHDAHSAGVENLSLKSGALQGAIVVDNPLDHRFENLHITYDGVNGQLPNLDLFNTAVHVASSQMGIRVSLQRMLNHGDTYQERLITMLRGMMSQALGHASGPHSVFIPYHVDALTLRPEGSGWQDDMALGRCVESLFRSLNNLMEHFHQSFFFYLLMQSNRFVSIGTYLPSAMLVAINFTIMAIALWVKSGRLGKTQAAQNLAAGSKVDVELIQKQGMKAIIPKAEVAVVERHILSPIIFVLSLHFMGIILLFMFNRANQEYLLTCLAGSAILNLGLPSLIGALLAQYGTLSPQQCILVKCFSLLILGMFLATLATINFSLAFLIGLLSFPFTFLGVPCTSPTGNLEELSSLKMLASNIVLHALSPPVVFFVVCRCSGVGMEEVLVEAAFGWRISGLWTQMIVWCVWWPAWLVATVFASPWVRAGQSFG